MIAVVIACVGRSNWVTSKGTVKETLTVSCSSSSANVGAGDLALGLVLTEIVRIHAPCQEPTEEQQILRRIQRRQELIRVELLVLFILRPLRRCERTDEFWDGH